MKAKWLSYAVYGAAALMIAVLGAAAMRVLYPSADTYAALSFVEKSVIFLEVRGSTEDEEGKQIPWIGNGSGFVIWRDAQRVYAMSNDHVVLGAVAIDVRFMNETRFYQATVYARDPLYDLVVVVFSSEGRPDDHPPMTIADSRKVKNLDDVWTIGNPNQLRFVWAQGRMVSVDLDENYRAMGESFFIADLTVNPGNSGGVAFDRFGHVMGMVHSISISPHPLAMIIPSRFISGMTPKLKEGGAIDHGFFDLGIEDAWTIGTETRKMFGIVSGQDYVVVTHVVEESPAMHADIRLGDRVLGIAPSAEAPMTEVRKAREFWEHLQLNFLAGDLVVVRIARNGEIMLKNVTLVHR